jgi:exosortase/archaeosortase family protein
MMGFALTTPTVDTHEPALRLPRVHPAILQLLALSPVLWWFGKRLNDGSDEPLGLLTLGLVCVLAWRERKSLHAAPQARVIGAMLVLLSVLGIHGLPPMLRAALAVAGMATWHGWYRRGGLMGLLLLSLPVMASMQFFIGYPLRLVAAEGAVRLLELGSLVVARSGTQIELGGKVIGVDPACSGVRMLWHALAAAMALAAIHRLSWRATIVAGFLAILLVIPANTIRAALLAVKEIGHLPEDFLGHGVIGLAGFSVVLLPLWMAISSRARPALPQQQSLPAGRSGYVLLAIAAVLAPVLAISTPRTPEPPGLGKSPSLFTFQGLTLPLQPLPQTAAESAFAKSFPGTLSSHRWGDTQVILRRVNVATRRLHPSADCLRAAGFATTDAFVVRLRDGGQWSRFHASKDGLRLIVHERITSELDGSAWTDVSAWYWSALRHPHNGPWQAETVISQ